MAVLGCWRFLNYPLMYFAQEYISLEAAVLLSAGVAVAIIGIRAVTLMRVWLALGGVVLPAVVILAITLVAAIWKPLQGILLTAEALGFFITAMMLMPKVQTGSAASPVAVEPLAAAPDVSAVSDAAERSSDEG